MPKKPTKEKLYQQCSKCIMDTTDSQILHTFDEDGICYHCKVYGLRSILINRPTEVKDAELAELVDKIKIDGNGKLYDCIIGVSGGIDSTYTAYLVKQLGLRPLAIHMDNGWDSELAVHNIEKVLQKLNIDLYTHVLDWDEFKSLQLAFLHASTPDAEIPTDHAITAVLNQQAVKHGVKYIINGYNVVTESIMPTTWSYGHHDWGYISAVNKQFGTKKLKSFPHRSLWKIIWEKRAKKLQRINILDYVEYNRDKVKEVLETELGWQDYGGKHYESIYTRFYQGYIMPRKFNMDKRRAHLSNLINSGQIDKPQALELIAQPCYPSEELQQEDYDYFLKKLEITETDFEEIMQLPIKSYWDFPSNETSLTRRTLFGMKKLIKR